MKALRTVRSAAFVAMLLSVLWARSAKVNAVGACPFIPGGCFCEGAGVYFLWHVNCSGGCDENFCDVMYGYCPTASLGGGVYESLGCSEGDECDAYCNISF